MSLGALVHNLVIVLTELIYPATNQLAPFLCLRRVAFNFAIHKMRLPWYVILDNKRYSLEYTFALTHERPEHFFSIHYIGSCSQNYLERRHRIMRKYLSWDKSAIYPGPAMQMESTS